MSDNTQSAAIPFSAFDLAQLREGKSKKRTYDSLSFVLVARRGGRLVVECGWVVPEADEDDAETSTYHPFADGRARCWVGRRVSTDDAHEAMRVYADYVDAIGRNERPTAGEKIGSVTR